MRSVKLPAVIVLLALAGCAGPEVVHTGSAASTRPTVHRATGRPSHHPVATAPAQPVVTRDAACRYLDTEFVMQTVGQHIARTTISTTHPESCAFYRPDGALAARVDGAELGSAATAAAKVHAVTGSGANPVSGLGDGGAVAITNDGAVLAVSTGNTLVVVRINQQSSLEATELARQYLSHL